MEQSETYEAVAIDISKLVVFIRTRWPFKLHVANVVAGLDDDPAVQVYLESATSLACAPTPPHGPNLRFLVLGLLIKQILVVRLLGWIRRQQAAPIRIPAPNSGSIAG